MNNVMNGKVALVTGGGRGIGAAVALGHYAAPSDVAAAVAFLATGEAHYITGATLDVDGGFTI